MAWSLTRVTVACFHCAGSPVSRFVRLARQLGERASEALADGPQWTLILDHEEPPDTATGPHFSQGPAGNPTTFRPAEVMAPREPLSELLVPLSLDPLTQMMVPSSGVYSKNRTCQTTLAKSCLVLFSPYVGLEAYVRRAISRSARQQPES